jgi:hypothetical protein
LGGPRARRWPDSARERSHAPGLLAFATEENGLEFGLGPLGLDEQPPFKDAEKGVRATCRMNCIAQIFSNECEIPRSLDSRPVAHNPPFQRQCWPRQTK